MLRHKRYAICGSDSATLFRQMQYRMCNLCVSIKIKVLTTRSGVSRLTMGSNNATLLM